MISTYIPVLALMVLAAGFVATMLILSTVLGPKRYSEMKDDPFECGSVPSATLGDRFSVKFYLVAMIFILFDIEVVFMYPWAIQLKQLGWYGFWAMSSFMIVLAFGLAYIWRKGVLDWT
ncbi:NADH-quinone oxidoreductase subunit A [bacterium]|nr:NADH-quinone oxidoreductase subunit A [bacterium]